MGGPGWAKRGPAVGHVAAQGGARAGARNFDKQLKLDQDGGAGLRPIFPLILTKYKAKLDRVLFASQSSKYLTSPPPPLLALIGSIARKILGGEKGITFSYALSTLI